VPVVRLGVQDRFGQSGEVSQLWQEYSIDEKSIVKYTREFVKKVTKK
jgi:transketolase C-terminal domain/subunit